jgi:hypothetical protein
MKYGSILSLMDDGDGAKLHKRFETMGEVAAANQAFDFRRAGGGA